MTDGYFPPQNNSNMRKDIGTGDFWIEEKDIPVVRLHENIMKINNEIYNYNLEKVIDFINFKKSVEYKRQLLENKIGFSSIGTSLGRRITDYKISLSIVKKFDYYKKKYPNMHFVQNIFSENNNFNNGYLLKSIGDLKRNVSNHDLVNIFNNMNSVDDKDIAMYLSFDFGEYQNYKYYNLSNPIGYRLNIIDILKRGGIKVDYQKDSMVEVPADLFNRNERKFIYELTGCGLGGQNYSYNDVKIHLYITNSHSCYTNEDNFKHSSDLSFEANVLTDECVFLMGVDGGYLITGISGNGNSEELSFDNFKEIMGDKLNHNNVQYYDNSPYTGAIAIGSGSSSIAIGHGVMKSTLFVPKDYYIQH